MESEGRRFWDRVADRYAARPVRDEEAYEATLADVRARLKPTDRVLEIGCGTGTTAIRCGGAVAEWTGTDFSPEMVRIARGREAPASVRFRQAEASAAFDDGPFDAICAFHILHLAEDLPALLAAIHDNLRPGGLLISKTWCFGDMALKMRMLFPVLRALGFFPPARNLHVDELRAAIADAGLSVDCDRSFGKSTHGRYIVARRPG
ncbi:class I SAM-dependent methyltransferase [Rhodobacter sp. NSM]|uniref:class I SAM-dependent methyltransferase n=1 Tax=Rhodobacter sp. NSM TaxID=3457501 RepID=UPI003FCF695A